jgi:predicted Holliday junction resolvase-like endonuclease
VNILSIIALILVCAYTIYQSRKEQKAEEKDLLSANQKIGALDERILDYVKTIHELEHSLEAAKEKFDKLQHQKISADVKLGQRYENILPFMEKFPYKDDEIRGLFNPIDLIVFREDEVVFVEVKTGTAQLSEKQRKIRDNIKEGRVRFETHRMDEKGVKVK